MHHIVLQDAHMSRGGSDQAGDAPDGCRLARAIGSEQSEDLARPRRKGHSGHSLQFSVRLSKLSDFDHASSQYTYARGRLSVRTKFAGFGIPGELTRRGLVELHPRAQFTLDAFAKTIAEEVHAFDAS